MTNSVISSGKLTTLLSERRLHSATIRYGEAGLILVAAFLFRLAIDSYVGPLSPFATLYPAIVLAAYYLDVGPAIMCTLLGFLGMDYCFIAPLHSFRISSTNELTLALTFLMVAGSLIALGASSRKQLRRAQAATQAAERTEIELRRARDSLERRVQERTQQLNNILVSMKGEIEIRKTTEERLRALSGSVLRLQDEERRHIARDLHDSAGQTLSALKLSLVSFEPLVADIPKAASLLFDLKALADEAIQEIRATSYLLHPPLLEEFGFASAAKWYLEGLSRRSGIKAEFELPPLRLEKNVELAFSRILQESLTNVIRHSGSKSVDIRLQSDGRNAVLSIRDHGTGIPIEKLTSIQENQALAGVGLAGMSERMRELGGYITIDSNPAGTCVTATLPLANPQRSVPEHARVSAASA